MALLNIIEYEVGKRVNRTNDIQITLFSDEYAQETVQMWRASKEKALGRKEQYSFEHQLNFLLTELKSNNLIYLAIYVPNNKVVGMMALNKSELTQLYVHVEFQRQGIGSRLLEMAKQLSAEDVLELYTFAININACNFYENRGFIPIAKSNDNQEELTDVLYQIKLK